MRTLMTANHALGDREALDRIWAEHGYWFFRDVLDKEALGAMRAEYMRELRACELVAADADEPLWNGGSMEKFPGKFEALHGRRVWQNFVQNPKINAFFEKALGDQVYWIPMDYYRVVPPVKPEELTPNIPVHQDGMSNPGVDFVTCWMPLMDIGPDVGGLAIAEGYHGYGYMEIIDGRAQFRDRQIPDEGWSTADYRMGDVVIFTPSMPHYGQGNTSDRFRLSLDIRAVRRSSRLPIVGKVTAISTERVTIRNEDGKDVTLTLDDETSLRALAPKSPNPIAITRDKVTEHLPPGTPVMATEKDGRAQILRAQN